MTRMTAQQYKAYLQTTRPHLFAERGEKPLRGPSWALELAVFAFVILLAASMPDLLDWIKTWPIWSAL